MPHLTHDRQRNIWGYEETPEASEARGWLWVESELGTPESAREEGAVYPRKLVTVECSAELYAELQRQGNVERDEWRMRGGVAHLTGVRRRRA